MMRAHAGVLFVAVCFEVAGEFLRILGPFPSLEAVMRLFG